MTTEEESSENSESSGWSSALSEEEAEAVEMVSSKCECQFYEPNRKRLKRDREHQRTFERLSRQLDVLCEAARKRSIYVRIDPPGCSIKEVIDKLKTLPGCEPVTPLFKFGVELFAKRSNREIFVALEEPEHQLKWMKDQLPES